MITTANKKKRYTKKDTGSLIRSFITKNFESGEMIPGESELISSLKVTRYSLLKELTKLEIEGIIERRQGQGTFISKRRNGVNSRNIAFIANEFESHMNAELMRGVDDYFRKRNLHLFLLNGNYDKKQEVLNLKKAKEEHFGGVIAILDPDSESLEAAKALVEGNIPFVQIDRHYERIDTPVVEADHEKGAYEAVCYLISKGHRRIAHITFPDPAHSSLSSVEERYKGYVKALQDHNIELKKEYLQQITGINLGEHCPDAIKDMMGYEPMHKLISMNEPPTALFLLNDSIAPSVYKAINNHGLNIPDDISVVGFNNDILAQYLNPPLTTIEQPFREIGRKAAGLLETLMEGETIPNKRIIINGNLRERESVQRINT
ncbi:MAG: substrate-binding domain-containing protein [Verrucomicrobiota bacterium]|nr:substrate-binding domain-containing protein [Verrucomicrobiota bacterium]